MPDFEDLIKEIKKREKAEAREKRLAIALGYDRDRDPSPKVVATGKDRMAEQIIKIAKENNIPIHEDKALAKILSVLELDSFIPFEAYIPVAEILSYIYRVNANAKKKK